jgi:hypothetical protein
MNKELTDQQIYNAICKIEGGWAIPYFWTSQGFCFRLMMRHNVIRELTGDDTYRAIICNWIGKPDYYRTTSDTFERAVFLVIIEANEDKL